MERRAGYFVRAEEISVGWVTQTAWARRFAPLPTLRQGESERMSDNASLRIGIDTGGTFTDIVCVDDTSSTMRVTKVSSTPSNPAVALVRGVHAILTEWG